MVLGLDVRVFGVAVRVFGPAVRLGLLDLTRVGLTDLVRTERVGLGLVDRVARTLVGCSRCVLDFWEVISRTGVAFDRKAVVDRLSGRDTTVPLARGVDEVNPSPDAVLGKDDIEEEDEVVTAEDAGALELDDVEVLVRSDVEVALSVLVDEVEVLLVVCIDVEVALSMLVEDDVVDAGLESGAALAVTSSHTITTASQTARRAKLAILIEPRIRDCEKVVARENKSRP